MSRVAAAGGGAGRAQQAEAIDWEAGPLAAQAVGMSLGTQVGRPQCRCARRLVPPPHAPMSAPRSIADPAFSCTDVKMRAAAPAVLSPYVIRLSWPVPAERRLATIWGTLLAGRGGAGGVRHEHAGEAVLQMAHSAAA